MARSAGMIPGTLGAIRETGRFAAAARPGGPGIRTYLDACFTGDHLVITRRGLVRWDSLTENDYVLARPENDPYARAEYKSVEEIFRTTARIWHVHVNGRVIRTTAEHPFWVVGKQWVAARELMPGDRLRSHDGQLVTVEEVIDAGYEETVYNCRVAEYHTYYVTGEGWGFSAWAHNTCNVKPRFDPVNPARIKSAFAQITEGNLRTGIRTNAQARAFIRTLRSHPGDDAGHIIGRLLGGDRAPTNIFPQLRNINRGPMAQLERQIADQVLARRQVFVRVSLKYATPTDLRPSEIVYQVRVDGISWTPARFPN